jgi:hypothetical protein
MNLSPRHQSVTAYIDRAGIAEDPKAPLFRTIGAASDC